MIIGPYVNCPSIQSTAVQLVFNPFSQLVPHLELYSQLQLNPMLLVFLDQHPVKSDIQNFKQLFQIEDGGGKGGKCTCV